jgi:membrane-bound inhibitor of C-type lysozyme
MVQRRLLAIACAGILSACATSTPAATSAASSSSKTIAVTAPPTRGDVVVNTVVYSCDDGTKLTVRFNDTAHTATVEAPGAAPVTLPEHKPVGASFDYSDASHRLSGKHDTATWTAGGKTASCSIV